MLRPVHFEVHVENPERAMEFYKTVFKWEFTKWEGGADYWMVVTGKKEDMGINGGMVLRKGSAVGNNVVTAFVCTMDVPNVDEYGQMILDAGGTLALPKMAIPGMAWLAYYKDTENNIFGIFQEDKTAQ